MIGSPLIRWPALIDNLSCAVALRIALVSLHK